MTELIKTLVDTLPKWLRYLILALVAGLCAYFCVECTSLRRISHSCTPDGCTMDIYDSTVIYKPTRW